MMTDFTLMGEPLL